MPVKTGRSGRSIRSFNKLHCNYKLNRYINHFRNVRGAYLALLGPSDSFLTPASTARTRGGGVDHVIGICRLGRAGRKPGVVCPLFSCFNKLHYRHKLYIYLYNSRHVRKPSPGRLGPNGSFSVAASTARISGAQISARIPVKNRA